MIHVRDDASPRRSTTARSPKPRLAAGAAPPVWPTRAGKNAPPSVWPMAMRPTAAANASGPPAASKPGGGGGGVLAARRLAARPVGAALAARSQTISGSRLHAQMRSETAAALFPNAAAGRVMSRKGLEALLTAWDEADAARRIEILVCFITAMTPAAGAAAGSTAAMATPGTVAASHHDLPRRAGMAASPSAGPAAASGADPPVLLNAYMAHGASLFLTRMTAWLRLSYLFKAQLAVILQAIIVFMRQPAPWTDTSGRPRARRGDGVMSSSPSTPCSTRDHGWAPGAPTPTPGTIPPFQQEFLEVGGILSLIDLMSLPAVAEVDKIYVLHIMRILTAPGASGRRFREVICENAGVRPIAEELAKTAHEGLALACRHVLIALGQDNPRYTMQVVRSLLALLTSPVIPIASQLHVAQALRALLPETHDLTPAYGDAVANLLKHHHLGIQYEAYLLLDAMLQQCEDLQKPLLSLLLGLLPLDLALAEQQQAQAHEHAGNMVAAARAAGSSINYDAGQILRPHQAMAASQRGGGGPSDGRNGVGVGVGGTRSTTAPVCYSQAWACRLLGRTVALQPHLTDWLLAQNVVGGLLEALTNTLYSESQRYAADALVFLNRASARVRAGLVRDLGPRFVELLQERPGTFYAELTQNQIRVLRRVHARLQADGVLGLGLGLAGPDAVGGSRGHGHGPPPPGGALDDMDSEDELARDADDADDLGDEGLDDALAGHDHGSDDDGDDNVDSGDAGAPAAGRDGGAVEAGAAATPLSGSEPVSGRGSTSAQQRPRGRTRRASAAPGPATLATGAHGAASHRPSQSIDVARVMDQYLKRGTVPPDGAVATATATGATKRIAGSASRRGGAADAAAGGAEDAVWEAPTMITAKDTLARGKFAVDPEEAARRTLERALDALDAAADAEARATAAVLGLAPVGGLASSPATPSGGTHAAPSEDAGDEHAYLVNRIQALTTHPHRRHAVAAAAAKPRTPAAATVTAAKTASAVRPPTATAPSVPTAAAADDLNDADEAAMDALTAAMDADLAGESAITGDPSSDHDHDGDSLAPASENPIDASIPEDGSSEALESGDGYDAFDDELGPEDAVDGDDPMSPSGADV
ncbi:hypothetical protein CXG81DRAFT_28665 [Caulochytrium protostelioides]|uniref:ARM repeat-containing protein n=1 Tax=Caulochytrium protostelioides TaxID=1555241 RepID=A0A4P9WYI2_9FUNG|nr:hypothetical protein CXG81DRAFT_28665 [Caulochytrium protostelioides]|eukprot:RKO98514.1 hypothetical protein CXG81DRAFT_28665 [Caulochytrium protostelioides]